MNHHFRALIGIIKAVFLTFVDVSSILGAVKRLGALPGSHRLWSRALMSAVEQSELDDTQENQGSGEVTLQNAGGCSGSVTPSCPGFCATGSEPTGVALPPIQAGSTSS